MNLALRGSHYHSLDFFSQEKTPRQFEKATRVQRKDLGFGVFMHGWMNLRETEDLHALDFLLYQWIILRLPS